MKTKTTFETVSHDLNDALDEVIRLQDLIEELIEDRDAVAKERDEALAALRANR